MERALPRRGQKCYTEPKPSRRQRAPGDQEELMLTFNHFNFNVADLDKSLAFYKEALGLEPVGERKAAADGSFIPGGWKDGLPPGTDMAAGPSPEV